VVGVVGVEVAGSVDKVVEGRVDVGKADFGKEYKAVEELVVVDMADLDMEDMAVDGAAVELASHAEVGNIVAQLGAAQTYVGSEDRLVLVVVVNRVVGLCVTVERVDWVEENDIPVVP
jgi:hypothetical protein